MKENTAVQEAHKRLSELKSGILFINKISKKMEMALSLVEKKLQEIDFVIWIAPANFLTTKLYMNEIKKNNRTFRHRIYFYSIESISSSDNKYQTLFYFPEKQNPEPPDWEQEEPQKYMGNGESNHIRRY